MSRTLAWGLIIVVREMVTRIVLPALHYAGTYERCRRLGDQSPVLHSHDDVAQSVYTIALERADHLAAVIRNERILLTRLFQPRASIRPSSPATASSKTHSVDAVYFNKFGLKGIDWAAPFLPTLEGLTKTGASIFVAFLTLNLLEVSERPEHL